MSDIGSNISQLTPGPFAGQVRDSVAKKDGNRRIEDAKAATGVVRDDGQTVLPAGQPVVTEGDNLDATLGRVASFLEGFVPDIGSNTRLRIEQDEETGRFVYRSIDKETGEVVRQFPAEEMLNLIARFRDAAGLIVDSKA